MNKATIIFLEIVFIFCAWWAGGLIPDIPPGWFYILLGLAAFRGGRAIAFNFVFEWLRDLVGIWNVDDSSGAGQSTEIHAEGKILRAIAELVICPICAGTWFAMALLMSYRINEQLGKGLIVALAAAGIGETLHWLSEFASWGGRAYREQAGSEWLEKNR